MLISLLIVNGTEQLRKSEAYKIARDYGINVTDRIDVTGEKHIGIKEIRQMIRSASLTPLCSVNKAVVIHPGENLTIHAQQALLKTLEEPPDNTIIILTAQHKSMLLPTVVSRCKVLHLETNLPTKDDVKKGIRLLTEIFTKDSANILYIADYLTRGKDASIGLDDLSAILRLVMIDHEVMNEIPMFKEQSLEANRRFAGNALKLVAKAKKALEVNVNSRLVFEVLFFKLSLLAKSLRQNAKDI